METQQRQVIEDYVAAYNAFDVDSMMIHLHSKVIFKNIVNEKTTLKTVGIDAFQEQAEAAKGYFKTRKQAITSWDFQGDSVTISLDYHAILAVNLPNGLKSGDTIELKGTSTFEFKDGKIIRLQDQS